MYEWFRAFHIISVIFWVAGLLILPRLYAYHVSGKPGGEIEQKMIVAEARLVKIILGPAMIGSLIFGIGLMSYRIDAFSNSVWLYIKLLLVFVLLGYHIYIASFRKKLVLGERPKSEKYFRMINEIPAILTILIVILAVTEVF